MGLPCAPQLANLACYTLEAEFSEKCQPEDMEMNFRVIDDILTLTGIIPTEKDYCMQYRDLPPWLMYPLVTTNSTNSITWSSAPPPPPPPPLRQMKISPALPFCQLIVWIAARPLEKRKRKLSTTKT